ncbi:LMBR1-like conserved region-containing protein [Trypanosoma conorhini]|uniref:LMBR1-like conserved region-containing protein n=1 Tax=Trypanosoma conorhini TaxID=83891 RepID=A0A3R7NLK2_9TRYP|nr:LMBR1-like conserved region-containing protein [Trypanosoma conorhini]RNF04430.1 LMBR1-like conserved region-containing protein [Trypanosoma conorhini]
MDAGSGPMSWWLVLLALIVAVGTVALVAYLVIVFEAEEEKNEGWWLRILVVLSFSWACFNILVLPYDVANVRGSVYGPGGEINVTTMWIAILVPMSLLAFVVCPFAMVYRETMEPDQTSVWRPIKFAAMVTAALVGVFLLLIFLLWATVGYTSIAYAQYDVVAPSAKSFEEVVLFSDTSYAATLRFKVSLFVYFVALTCTIGWMLFFLFGGVGLVAMPVDCFMRFRDRPRPITAAEYALRRAEIAQESQRLMCDGNKLEQDESAGHSGRRHRRKVFAFRQRVAELEAYHDKVETSYREKGGEVVRGYLFLFLGLVFASISILWILQVIIHNLTHLYPLLSNMFIRMDRTFMLFGVLAYGCFSFYLLSCVVKGCVKLGGNLLLFQIYPMELGGTLMNAFLFNAMLVMITSTAVVQFCTVSFAEYAVNTNVGAMFTVYVANLQGIKYILTYLQYPLLVIAGVSLVWLLLCPKRRVDDE